MTATSANRRRYLTRSKAGDRELAEKAGTFQAKLMVVSTELDLPTAPFMVAMGMAYYVDMRMLQGETEVIVYPNDIADVIGMQEARIGSLLRDLVKLKLVNGTAAAGYWFAGPMLAFASPRR